MKETIRRNTTRIMCTLIALILIISLAVFVPNASASDKLGRFNLISQTEYAVSPGVTEKDILLNSTNGNEQNKGFLMEIDPGNPNVSLKAGYKDYNGTRWGMQTLTDQAAIAEQVFKQTDPNANVVGVVNTSFFNMSTGEPNGALVMHGVKYHDTTPGWGYLAILKDGSIEIRDGKTPIGDDVLEATAGCDILVRNGEIPKSLNPDTALYPRCAVGIKEDGRIILYVNDGRQAPKSIGLTFHELAEIMRDLGCVDALNFDGGGSATMLTEREGTGELTVKNSVSDGIERTVSGTLMVVSTAKPSGVFDHASLSPNGEYYTPGSNVAFSALGVDSAGANVDLPEGLTWALEDDSMGTIDPSSGVFTASEKTGPVVVQLNQGDKVVGKTTIHVQAPDKITFKNASINLSYGQVTDLDMSASYQGNALNVKDGDFNWTITKKSGNGEAGYFEGNLFHASQNNETRNLTVTADLTAVSKWDSSVSAVIEVGIGKEPVIIMDGGDSDGLDYSNPAKVQFDPSGGKVVGYYNGESGHGDIMSGNYGRGGVDSAEQVDIDSGKVRFGEKALKLNYDFTGSNGGTEGACVGFARDLLIEGSPTAIGFWCYAPEFTPNLWVRIRARDGSGNPLNLDFSVQNKPGVIDKVPEDSWDYGTCGGINWTGWRYLEADLTNAQGPIQILAGEMLRFMDVPGIRMGNWICQKDDTGTIVVPPQEVGHQKGCIYIDNVQILYGTNNADTKNPEIKLLQAGPTLDSAVDLAGDGSTVINSNEVTFYSEFADVQDENTSGLDFGYLYLDGKNMSENENFVADMNDGKLILNAMKLANGTHTVKVLVHDKYGNEAVVTRTFTVQGNDESLTSVNLEPQGNNAPLGGKYQIDLTSNKVEDVKSVSVEMTVGNANVSGIDWAEDYKDSTYSFKDGVLAINAVRSEDAQSQGDATIGSIKMDIPYDLQAGSFLTYAVTEGSVTYATEKDSNVVNTFALPTTRIPVTAAYKLTTDVVYEGADAADVTVADMNGNPARNVKVYLKNAEGEDQLLGTTTKNGIVAAGELAERETFTIYAVGADGYSFPLNGKRLPSEGGKIPAYIIENATADACTMKSISWTADPSQTAQKAVIEYAPANQDFETAKKSVNGESTLKGFVDAAVLINNGVITGLQPNTEYQYRVGDGENWSDYRSFRTAIKDADEATNIFILGDTQTEEDSPDTGMKLNRMIAKDGRDYALGIQLGDSIEKILNYDSWKNFLDLMDQPDGALINTDVLHVIGNHEQDGDPSASAAKAMYGIDPSTKHYSVTYGNVYVATIDFAFDRESLEDAAAWLKQDAAASDAPWKILVLHQPPYYTNPEGGESIIHQILPPAIDEADIDLVFSGHDHAFARTCPLKNYEPVELNDGTIYYIAGSVGEKSYAAVDNPDFHFEEIRGKGQPMGFEAIYLTVSATDNDAYVNAYDLEEGLIGKEIHLTKNQPCPDGEHSWVYRPEKGDLKCEKCLARMDKAEYSGFAKMENTENDQVYMIAGVLQKGWITYDEEMLHAGDDYILHETETRDTRTCTENGHIETVCKTCGETYKGSETFASGHKWDENHVCTVCGKQGIDIATLEATISSPYYVIKSEGQAVRPTPTVKDGDYTLNIRNSTLGRDGYVSWENYDRIGTATVLVDGRGDYYGTLRIDYDLVPDKVTNVQVSGSSEDGATVSWTALPGAETYKVYRYDFDSNQLVEIASTKDDSTSVIVSGLEANKTYKICVKACVSVDGKDYESVQYEWVNLTTNKHTHQLTAVEKVDSTCKETGTEAHWKCDVCGKLFADADGKQPIAAPAVIPVKEHSWGEWTVSTEATETEEGLETRACSVCGETEERAIPVLAHVHEMTAVAKVDATCTTTGTEAYWKCDGCGRLFADADGKQPIDAPVVIPVKAHSWSDWTVTKQPTETEQGEETRLCAVCGEKETRPIEKLAPAKPEKCDGGDSSPSIKLADVDRSANSWYHEAVDWAYVKGVTTGMTETTFGPNEPCTRAQAVTFLWRANGSPEPTSNKCDFVDVSADMYYYKAVLWAVEKNITNGVDATHFAPDMTCSRAHIVTFLYRAANMPAVKSAAAFTDVPANEWFTDAVAWAAENGITDGVGNNMFAPAKDCVRAEIVTFLYRDQMNKQ